MIQLVAFLAAVSMLAGAAGQVNADKQAVGKVESRSFTTQSLPPTFHAPKAFAEAYKVFQIGGTLVPESITVKSVILVGSSQLRLKPDETKRLYAGLDQVYARISSDDLFKNINSALPYCLADKRPSHGHYFAYYPKKMTDDTQVIVFLHGFGGNFLFYTYRNQLVLFE